MDEQNRYPIQEPEQPPTPSEPPAPMTQPYSSYGWRQTPPPPPPKKKGYGAVIAVSVACVAVVVLLVTLIGGAIALGDGLGNLNFGGDTSIIQPSGDSGVSGDRPTLTITELEDGADGLTAREIVSRNLDSTVLLKIYTEASSGYPFGQQAQEQQAGSASGIVMTADGYIITNWHCVIDEDTNQPFDRVDVVMYDGTVYKDAQVVGSDSSTDLAVIKVEATGLQPAEFGDSTQMQLGDRVVALGNAGGLGFSATQGILSGLARDVYEDTGYAIQCFQVDAAINPGNSGGPLFNAAGQVIAVNSAKIVAEGYEGLGFAIPINEAKTVVDSLIANGYVRGRVSLGITGNTYSDAYYQGFLIRTIENNSPLRNTEARKGDLITAVNDTEVTDYGTLRAALAKHKVGDTVTLTMLRSSNRKVEELKVTVKLIESTQ